MNFEAWHFLVSRNRHLDYRTVVAPDFICETKVYNLLARVADGDLTEPNAGFFRQIFSSKAGDFTIGFRVIKALEKYIDNQGKNEVLKDSFGREIYMIEGIVIKGILSKKDFLVSNQDIEKAHKSLMTDYKEFWEYSEPRPAKPSKKFFLEMESSGNTLKMEELPPFQVSSNEGNPKRKSKNNFVRFLVPIIPVIVLLLLAILLTKIVYPFGKSIVDGCTTTQEVDIVLNKQNKIDEAIAKQDLQKKYPQAEVFLKGSLRVESPKDWQPLQKREQLAGSTKYTISLDGNNLQMQDHPLELAIAQFRNQKVLDQTTIQAKIIDKKECKKN